MGTLKVVIPLANGEDSEQQLPHDVVLYLLMRCLDVFFSLFIYQKEGFLSCLYTVYIEKCGEFSAVPICACKCTCAAF